jgi:hypothetical protein
MSTADTRWQRVPKARRARVYRAIGHAAREARLDGDPEIADDLRIVMELLRAHGRAAPPGKSARSKQRRKR